MSATAISISSPQGEAATPGIRALSRESILWYLIWSPLAAIAVMSASSLGWSFTGNWQLFVAPVLAGFAVFQNLRIGLDARLRQLSILFLLMLCTMLLLMPVVRLWARRAHGVDFSAYYIAAKVIDHQAQSDLYVLPLFPDGRVNLSLPAPKGTNWAEIGAHYRATSPNPFIYPPLFAVLVRPLAWLPLSFNGAYIVWNSLMLFLLGASVVLTISAAGLRCTPKLMLVLAVGVSSFYPVIESLAFGQADIPILFLLAVSLWFLTRCRWTGSALPLAAAVLLKLTPLLCVPVLIIHRKGRWLAAFTAAFVLILSFAIWQAGWTEHRTFLHYVLPRIGPGSPVIANVSIGAFVQELLLWKVSRNIDQPLTIAPYIILISRIVAGFVYGSLLIRIFAQGRRGDMANSFAALVLVTLAVSPISWVHHYVIALLPFLFFWARPGVVRSAILLPLWGALGINFFGFAEMFTINPAIRLIFAPMLPVLVILVAHAALHPIKTQHDAPEPAAS